MGLSYASELIEEDADLHFLFSFVLLREAHGDGDVQPMGSPFRVPHQRELDVSIPEA